MEPIFDSWHARASRSGRPMIRGMTLGMPFWGFERWQGRLYARDSRPADFLSQYARVFNGVEGNTTFYATPSAATVGRWLDQAPDSFRFCFKLPRAITHDAMLEGAEDETAAFLERLRPLGPRLGPVMIQLPPSFGVERLSDLARFLEGLPRDLRYAVELRHEALAEEGMPARLVDELLAEAEIGRVIMDTRPLRDGPSRHPDILAARHKKPDLPVREIPITDDPIVRIVFHPEAAVNDRWLDHWATVLAGWIRAGREPHVFVHSPSNVESPEIARTLHERIGALEGVGAMPDWPGERGESASGQLALL